MVLSILYDKELSAKVFQLRDSERYTNSTQTTLEVDYQNNRRDYISVDLTAGILKNLGKSSVAFYCDDELVNVVTCNQGTSSVATSTQVSYGYHKFYAKYLGNAQCLSSKSGVVEFEVTEPDIPKSSLSFDVTGLTNNWVETVAGATVTLSHKDNNNAALTGKTVKISVNGETPSNFTINSASANISSLLPNNYSGELTIRAEFEGDVAYLECETETKFYVGYDLSAVLKYAKIGVGDEAAVDVKLAKTNGGAVANKTVKLNG